LLNPTTRKALPFLMKKTLTFNLFGLSKSICVDQTVIGFIAEWAASMGSRGKRLEFTLQSFNPR